MEVEVNRVSSTLFEIMLKTRKQMISLRLDSEIVTAYDKIAALLNMKFNTSNTRITRTRLMQIILESAVKRPDIIVTLVLGNGE
jgi:DNA-binding GntR family transcriptional regulator